MTAELNLLPCPFCGGVDVITHLEWSMMCSLCGAEGALCETKIAAVTAWNRRATLALTGAGEQAPQAVVGAELPPLPSAAHRGPDGTGSYFDSYTANQMQDYARTAIAADRAHLANLSTTSLTPLCSAPGAESAQQASQGAGMQVARSDLDAEMQAMLEADKRAGGELQLVPQSMLWLALQGWQLARQGQGEPVLYVRPFDLDGTMPGSSVITSKVAQEEWSAPLYTSPAQASADQAECSYPNCACVGGGTFKPCVKSGGAQASAAPADGWKLVPAKPTDDMIVAFAEQWYSKLRCIDDCEMEDCYAAMLAASPEPATAAVPVAAALLAVERMRGCAATYIEDHAKDTYPGQIGLRPQDVATMWAQEIHGIDAKAYLDEAIDDLKADKAPVAQPVEQPADDARDAARYRAWRQVALTGNEKFIEAMQDAMPQEKDEMEAIDWDIAIDAAMQASKGTTECQHENAVVQHTGDGRPVEFCPDCGTNTPLKGATDGAVEE